MKISQIILKGVKNFDDFHYSFEDSWTQTVPEALLLMGPNGSGKTTLMRAIVGLCEAFGKFMEEARPTITEIPLESDRLRVYQGCQIAAIEIKDFADNPIWIYISGNGAKGETINHFVKEFEEYDQFGLYLFHKKSSCIMSYRPAGYSPSNPLNQSYNGNDISLGGREKLRESFLANRYGSRADLPNILFLPSEIRILSEPEENFAATPEKVVYNWLAEYRPATRREGSIENYLFTLKALDEQSYNRIVGEANKFLQNKAIAGFDPITRQLMIKTKSGQSHPIYELSSGEKQVLLMLAFITRELRPGGVVLIDEPDLHLHVSLSTAFVSHLKRIVAEQNGQLIIASHAPELWELFPETQKIRLGAAEEVLQ